MDSHQIKQHLTDLVIDGREEVVIEELLAISNSSSNEIRNSIAAFSRRYQKFEGEKIGGSLSIDKINTTSDKISQALLAIIEQLTEESPGHHQTVDLEAIFGDIDDPADSANILSKGRAKAITRISIIAAMCVVLVIGILAFNGNFSKSTDVDSAVMNSWIGVWHHQMESTGDSKITGTLSFERISENEITGRADNVFPDGSETTNTLTQIKFSDDGKVIEGIWATENVQSLHGTFTFNLEGENQFDGHYTVVNQDGEYYWKGSK